MDVFSQSEFLHFQVESLRKKEKGNRRAVCLLRNSKVGESNQVVQVCEGPNALGLFSGYFLEWEKPGYSRNRIGSN